MKKICTVFVLLVMFVLVGCSSKSLKGEWEKITESGKGEKVTITDNEITVDNQVLSYKISEDKKHLVLSQGSDETSVSYKLDGNKLTIDDEVYYRVGSKEYKEQEKKIK